MQNVTPEIATQLIELAELTQMPTFREGLPLTRVSPSSVNPTFPFSSLCVPSTLLSTHNSSVAAVLKAVYPEHNWDPSKFKKKAQSFWTFPENQLAFMETLRAQLGLKAGLEGWYDVTLKEMIEHGAGPLLTHLGHSPMNVLLTLYPDHKWELWKFKGARASPSLVEEHKVSQ